ncbi:MAG: hypothetical protein PHY44_04180 [Lachnospiraceae bacterium]|nr:hypothetical protein [Lachnospiraceae bacterium]
MKFIKDGVLYLSGDDAESAFYETFSNIGRFRRQGMSFELTREINPEARVTTNEKYCYPVEKCRRWFAGEVVR